MTGESQLIHRNRAYVNIVVIYIYKDQEQVPVVATQPDHDPNPFAYNVKLRLVSIRKICQRSQIARFEPTPLPGLEIVWQ